jgi:hypothetical protein
MHRREIVGSSVVVHARRGHIYTRQDPATLLNHQSGPESRPRDRSPVVASALSLPSLYELAARRRLGTEPMGGEDVAEPQFYTPNTRP